MAYTRRTSGPIRPGPGDPGVIWAHFLNSAAETNMAVKVPWDDVELVYAYMYNTVAIDATGTATIDLELNAAGGTQLATATLAKSGAIGTVTELTMDPTARTPLSNKSSINIEIDGSASAAGACMIYLYFEPATP